MNTFKGIALAMLVLPAAGLMAQAEQPNIVVILTDQQSYNMISAFSDLYRGSYVSTPNLDKLAKNGISFTQTYCANPVSVPSRFSLFTGMMGGQFNVRDNRCASADESQIRGMLATNAMGNVFERGGYDTFYGGKVHLPFSAKQGGSKFAAPAGYGFQNCYTSDERDLLGVEAAKIIDEKAKGHKKPFLLVASFLNPHDICLESSTNLSPVVEDKGGRKQVITECVKEMRVRAAAIDSVEFYKNHAPALPYNRAITANYPKVKNPVQNFPDWYWRKYRWTYAQLVELVDSHIGHIIDALDRHPELRENTIVVFTSDHGEMQGAHKLVTKGVPYNECQSVPFIFSGKGIKKGERDNSLVCNGTDLLPTLCDLAGIAKPKTDGLSFAPRILGKGKSPQREALYLEGEGFLNVIDGQYKYTYFDGKQKGEMLIDLRSDKGEQVNCIESNLAKAESLKQFIPMDKLPQQNKKNKEKKQIKDGAAKKNGVKKGNRPQDK